MSDPPVDRNDLAYLASLTGTSVAKLEETLRQLAKAFTVNAEAIRAVAEAADDGPQGSYGRAAQRSPYDIGRRQ